MEIPDPFQQHGTGHNAARVAHQHLRQGEFLGQQIACRACPPRRACRRIMPSSRSATRSTVCTSCTGGLRARALTRAISSAKGEGLGQIVIAARLKPLDPVVNAAKGGQEKDRRLATGSPQGAHQR